MMDAPTKYAGFWKRLFAFFIDFVLFMPLMYLGIYLSGKTQMFYALWFLPGVAIGLWFGVYLVFRYGGTPGKLLMKVRIQMLDGSPVTMHAALVRYSVILVLSTVQSVIFATAALGVPAELYFNESYLERTKAILSNTGSIYRWLEVALQIWVWGEYVVMLCNQKKRAAHDFMAGTVVVDMRDHA